LTSMQLPPHASSVRMPRGGTVGGSGGGGFSEVPTVGVGDGVTLKSAHITSTPVAKSASASVPTAASAQPQQPRAPLLLVGRGFRSAGAAHAGPT